MSTCFSARIWKRQHRHARNSSTFCTFRPSQPYFPSSQTWLKCTFQKTGLRKISTFGAGPEDEPYPFYLEAVASVLPNLYMSSTRELQVLIIKFGLKTLFLFQDTIYFQHFPRLSLGISARYDSHNQRRAATFGSWYKTFQPCRLFFPSMHFSS